MNDKILKLPYLKYYPNIYDKDIHLISDCN